MTATERLRELLDERGIEWGIADYSRRRLMTVWHANGQKWQFFEDRKTGWTHLSCRMDYLTPEQAIAATLGAGTCHNVHEPPKDTTFWPAPHFKCSVCGRTHVSTDYVFYCPGCGREVV